MSQDGSCVSFPFGSYDESRGKNQEGKSSDERPAAPVFFGSTALRTPGESPPPPSKMEADALRVLKEELSDVPHEDKASLAHAQRTQPDLVNDEHLLRFLEAENYDAGVSVVLNLCGRPCWL